MIAGFIKIVFFLVLTIVILAFVGIYKVLQHVNNITRKFGEQQPYTGSQQSRRTTGESEIIDTRSQEKANRKIFSDDEGEFVDYKEE